ncbi:VOC family protein [Saccharicrinis sp. FJH54]|uniref:VOC family protein n=1 Tax=Saccharicrinis sp. FJH54 TaxID=3344665 RepID=UPI0035D40AD3
MSGVSLYLNFRDQTEEAFTFYKRVFGAEFEGDGIMRFKDVPQDENMPSLPEKEGNLVMHVSLPILNGFKLMGADAPETLGFTITKGNNMNINLEPETRVETDKLFVALSEGGKVTQPLQDMFWGDYFGTCIDKFGICWMFNCAEKK